MADTIRILILEDSAADAELMQREMKRSGLLFDSQTVSDKEGFLDAIGSFHPDLVLSDYTLPQFNGMEALKLLTERLPDVPLIIVTGTISEEVAVDCMVQGAADYVLKSHLTKLPQAVHRAIERAELIRQKRRAIQLLQEEYDLSQLYLDVAGVVLLALDREGRITLLNRKGYSVLGYDDGELTGRNWFATCVPERIREKLRSMLHAVLAGKMEAPDYFESPIVTKSGGERLIAWHNTVLRDADGKNQGTLSSGEDITERRFAEEALKESAGRMRTMIQNIPGAVYHCANDPEWTMYYISPAIETISGYPCSEFIENRVRSYASIIHPDDREMVKDRVQQAVSMRNMYELEYRVICSNGSVKWVGERGQGVFDDTGNLKWLDGVLFDISDRKRAEDALRESEAKYSALIKYAGDAILLCDDYGKIIEVNRRAEVIFGRAAEELIGKNFLGFHTESVLSRADGFFRRTVSLRKPTFYESELSSKDGGEIPVEILLTPIEYLGKTVVKASVRDISVRKRIDTIKNNIIRDVTHKIKTPIATAQMACDLAFDSLKKEDPELRKRSLELIAASIGQLRADVDRVMEFFVAQLKGVGEERLHSSLRKVAEGVMREGAGFVSDRALSFEVDIGEEADTVFIEEVDLYTVLGNIVSNAVHSTREGKISMTAEVVGEQVRITVADTGAGIPADALDKVFEPFFQVNPASPGMGLGLPICKQIVERYNGNIEVRSEGLGKGARVIVELPRVNGERDLKRRK